MRSLAMLVAVGLVVVGCSPEVDGTDPDPPAGDARSFPPAPAAPDGPLEPDVARAVGRLHEVLATTELGPEIDVVATSGDPRIAWYLSDLLRFETFEASARALLDMFNGITGQAVAFDPFGGSWVEVTDTLIAWDLPAFDGYVPLKQALFRRTEPRWTALFEDAEATVDWRHVTWGGVPIDDRPLGNNQPCPFGCIPALDDPELTPAAAGDWYADDRIVFGVVVGGEAVALPKHQMETHEMVNMTVGGTRLGIPYCTLCGSAQAWVTEGMTDEPLVLRTSGLLQRSNKMMFDLGTMSLIDTFTGRATSGPLREQSVQLQQVSVITSTWGDWKASHPNTRIVAEDGGIGRTYRDDPLRGRDDDGPIFPIGEADPRLPVQSPVVGVITTDGQPVAFARARLEEALADGSTLTFSGVTITRDGGGFRASQQGTSIPAHEAFWFAWSQFHPDTALWVE